MNEAFLSSAYRLVQIAISLVLTQHVCLDGHQSTCPVIGRCNTTPRWSSCQFNLLASSPSGHFDPPSTPTSCGVCELAGLHVGGHILPYPPLLPTRITWIIISLHTTSYLLLSRHKLYTASSHNNIYCTKNVNFINRFNPEII